MSWFRRSKLDLNPLREITRQRLMTYSEQIPDQDRPFMGTGTGQTFTPREIHRNLEQNTTEGRALVEHYMQTALESTFDRTMQELLQDQATHETSEKR